MRPIAAPSRTTSKAHRSLMPTWSPARVLIVRMLLALALLLGVAGLVGPASALASGLSSESIGIDSQPELVNGQWEPTDLSLASQAGGGVVRMELDQQNTSTPWANADAAVTLAAEAHLRVSPMLGIATQMSSGSAAAPVMDAYITAFAERYGPNGSFWAANPTLPYLPIDTYEIGNEPNLPVQYVQDSTHLHWTDPSDYATVYAAARAALHEVDPSATALVGGLVDAGGGGVGLAQVEQWLAALNPSEVDAVGYHPYVWQTYTSNLAMMSSDTASLRGWMDSHGMQNVPIEIDEVGACEVTGPGCEIAFSSAQWGSFVAGFAQWALCTPSMDVKSFQAFYWGADPSTSSSTYPYLPLVEGDGSVTSYGQDYLAEMHTLTTQGCPSPASSQPSSGATVATVGANPLPTPMSMWLQLRGVQVHGHRLTLRVREIPSSGHVTAVAVKGHHRVRLRVMRRRDGGTLLTFGAKLPAGRWTLIVRCSPPSGYAAPASLRHRVRVP